MSTIRPEDQVLLDTFKRNQPALQTTSYETIATSATAKSSTLEFDSSVSFVAVTVVGADAFVDFVKDADQTSMLAPAGVTTIFEIHAEDACTVSVRSVSGTGYATVRPYI